VIVIAIDGPAASGKGTLGRRLAGYYGLAHLDTGLIYRAVAWLLQQRGFSLEDEGQAEAAAKSLTLKHLDDTVLRGRAMGEAASRISVIPQVRAALLDWQRRFAAQPGGAVLDGRDIGTVICPDAPVKLFVTATPEERARRRWKELSDRGEPDSYEEIFSDILRRDERDTTRSLAPLHPAVDAHILDTTTWDTEETFRQAVLMTEALLTS
jgi:CMP/dCMP kinase